MMPDPANTCSSVGQLRGMLAPPILRCQGPTNLEIVDFVRLQSVGALVVPVRSRWNHVVPPSGFVL